MNCREFVEFIIEYREGTLPADQRAIFDAHIKACPECGDYLEGYIRTIGISRLAFECREESEPPATMPERLVDAILRARKKQG